MSTSSVVLVIPKGQPSMRNAKCEMRNAKCEMLNALPFAAQAGVNPQLQGDMVASHFALRVEFAGIANCYEWQEVT
jgi:hypothetical protein